MAWSYNILGSPIGAAGLGWSKEMVGFSSLEMFGPTGVAAKVPPHPHASC